MDDIRLSMNEGLGDICPSSTESLNARNCCDNHRQGYTGSTWLYPSYIKKEMKGITNIGIFCKGQKKIEYTKFQLQTPLLEVLVLF